MAIRPGSICTFVAFYMRHIFSYPLSALYYLAFGLTLVVFHPVQWFCLTVFGYQAHKKSVDYLNGCLIACSWILGYSYKITGSEQIPKGVPVILVSNHQSLFDIIMIGWFLRKCHPKYVSKIELSKGIPSVSYNLRHGGSVVIDRKDGKQALREIKKIGEYIEQTRRSAVIFPEGTRSKNGYPKPFAENGLKILTKYAPSACIVPITINNSWKTVKNGKFPLTLGNKLTLDVHPPLPPSGREFSEVFLQTEQTITRGIVNKYN